MAAPLGAHHRAAVRAAVDQDADLAAVLPDHDDRFPAHARGEVVAGGFHLALVAQDQPGAAEDMGHLQVENRRVRVHGPVHAVGLH
jgi:hypothetical protein